MSDFKTRTLEAFFWHSAFRISSQILTWCLTLIIVRILRPEDYGLMGIGMLLIAFLDLFNDMGLGAAIIHADDSCLDNETLSTVFWMSIFLGITIYTCVFFMAPFVSQFFNETKTINIFRTLAFGFIIGGIRRVPYNLLTKTLQFKNRGFAELISYVVSSTLCLFTALFGGGVWSLVLAYLSKEIVLSSIVWLVHPFKPTLSFSLKKLRLLMSFGAHVSLSRMLWYCYSHCDYLIIARMLGKTLLGYYSVAFTLSSLPITKVNQLIREVAFPSYSQIQSDKGKVGYYFLKNIQLSSTVLFPILFGLSLVAESFVITVLGVKWSRVIFLLRILALSGVIRCIASQHAPVLNAIGKPQINVKYSAMMSVIMPSTFVLMSQYGIEGVALSWLLVYPFLVLYLIIMTIRILDLSLRQFFDAIIWPLVGCISMSIPVIALQMLISNMLVELLVTCIVGATVYVLVVFSGAKEFMHDLLAIFSVYYHRLRRAI